METKKVYAYAPATIGNVSVGFDILGMAINEPGDVVSARFIEGDKIKIASISGDEGKLPLQADKNTAGIAALELLKKLNIKKGIELELYKEMPIGSGLGSSAASAAAAVWAVNMLLDYPLSKEELLSCAVEAERFTSGSAHADNVAPSLLGGLILIQSYEPLTVQKIPVPENLVCVVVHPNVEILTHAAREILPKQIALDVGVKQWATVASFVAACYEKNIEKIGKYMTDHIAEPYRKNMIPHFDEAKSIALESGAAGFGISGSGPSVFSICNGESIASEVSNQIQSVFNKYQINCESYVSGVNFAGATEVEAEFN